MAVTEELALIEDSTGEKFALTNRAIEAIDVKLVAKVRNVNIYDLFRAYRTLIGEHFLVAAGAEELFTFADENCFQNLVANLAREAL